LSTHGLRVVVVAFVVVVVAVVVAVVVVDVVVAAVVVNAVVVGESSSFLISEQIWQLRGHFFRTI